MKEGIDKRMTLAADCHMLPRCKTYLQIIRGVGFE